MVCSNSHYNTISMIVWYIILIPINCMVYSVVHQVFNGILFFLHSSEYSDHTACLATHAKSCLSGVLAAFTDDVTKLLQLMTFHCGNLTVDPTNVNAFLLSVIKCQKDVFSDTVTCWDKFSMKLKANRSDPALCR